MEGPVNTGIIKIEADSMGLEGTHIAYRLGPALHAKDLVSILGDGSHTCSDILGGNIGSGRIDEALAPAKLLQHIAERDRSIRKHDVVDSIFNPLGVPKAPRELLADKQQEVVIRRVGITGRIE